MSSVVSSQSALGTLDGRVYLRKIRNWAAALFMAAFYVQVLGVPDVGWPGERPLLRLTRLERPVWSYGWSAVTFVWSELIQENAS